MKKSEAWAVTGPASISTKWVGAGKPRGEGVATNAIEMGGDIPQGPEQEGQGGSLQRHASDRAHAVPIVEAGDAAEDWARAEDDVLGQQEGTPGPEVKAGHMR